MLKRPKCPKCGNKEILYKRTTRSYWCRRCGAEFDKPEWEEKKEKK